MAEERFEARGAMPVPAGDLYAWHARPGALERLQPPWERVEILERAGGVADGARVRLRARVGPAWSEWRVRHEGHREGRQFVDVLESGPFASWRHEHCFEPRGSEASELVDRIRYRLPLGRLGRWVAGGLARRRIARLFRYRHAVTRDDLEFWRKSREHRRMKVLIAGANGMIGSALKPFLTTQGHEVVELTRSGSGDAVGWDPARGVIDEAGLDGVDAVVNLAGANLAAGRWTRARKREILDSRVLSTRLLVDALGRREKRPGVLVCSSAVGYYGDTADQTADEDAPPGKGFLADVCRQWEAEAMRAEAHGLRVVRLRTGVVLTPAGGALRKLLPVFRKGLGGPVGGGHQWMSWISLDDMVAVIAFALQSDRLDGAVNAVAPEAVTNAGFAHALGRVLRRPTLAPVPASVLKLMYGEMAAETVLASCRVEARRLREAGFSHRHPTLEAALRHVLGREDS